MLRETKPAAKRHVFVVGCSRGGTTVIQSILANHPDVTSFPETHLPWSLLDDMDLRRFGVAVAWRREPRLWGLRLINRMGYSLRTEGLLPVLPDAVLAGMALRSVMAPGSIRSFCRNLVAALDEYTPTSIWVEKSPQNIFVIEVIQRHCPDALFVHVVRNGPDTVGSLRDAGLRFDPFRARFGTVDGVKRAVAYWNRTVEISASKQGDPHHAVVRYEDVVDDPARAMEPVSKLLGIEFTPEMFAYKTAKIIKEREIWKAASSDRIEPRPSKFGVALTAEEQAWARPRIRDVDAYVPRQSPSRWAAETHPY